MNHAYALVFPTVYYTKLSLKRSTIMESNNDNTDDKSDSNTSSYHHYFRIEIYFLNKGEVQ